MSTERKQRALRAGESYSIRPYEVLGRELSERVSQHGLTLATVAKRIGATEGTLKAACSGMRPLSPQLLGKVAATLTGEGENANYVLELLKQICKPGASRTHLARGLRAPVHVGYLESPPFAYASRGNVHAPEGLLVQIFEAYFQTLRIGYDWTPVNYDKLIDALENHTVDLITGLVLESPQRRVRAYFVPLPMPFRLGINAVTSSPHIPAELDYLEFCDILASASPGSVRKLNLITVADEIADDFFPLTISSTVAPLRDRHRKVAEAIRYYTIDHPDKDLNVVFADQMTCSANLAPGSRLVFKQSVGSLRGGLLLPAYDPEWRAFIESSLFALLSAKLPRIGMIFSEFLSHLMPFIPQQNTHLDLAPRSRSPRTSNPFDGAWSLDEWISTFWPDGIPIPDQFNALIHNTDTTT